MLYFFPDTWVKSGHGTKENNVLSALDKAFIASEQAYPHIAVQAIESGVNAAPVSTSIGLPGEEDLFKFNVKKSGRYGINFGK
jgi:hypothetical protein